MFIVTIKTPGRGHWRRSGIFTDNFEHISHLARVSISSVSTVNF